MTIAVDLGRKATKPTNNHHHLFRWRAYMAIWLALENCQVLYMIFPFNNHIAMLMSNINAYIYHVQLPYYKLSFCMVCAYVQEDNPQALASGLSPLHRHNHTITALLHQHACALCALWDIWCRTFEYHSKVQQANLLYF